MTARRPRLAPAAALLLLAAIAFPPPATAAPAKPNIVFLVADDLGTDLGVYGNPDVRTPNLDRFAAQGTRFANAIAPAPVCAPSRAGMFTGRHPIRVGAHLMRSRLAAPPRSLPEQLREAGYFVAWPNKIDLNFDPPETFRDSAAHWTDRPLPREPFFLYLNLGEPHEGALKNRRVQDDYLATLGSAPRTDPAAIRLPPYYPDHPAIRADLALHYDLIAAMDLRIGKILDQLERAGVADRTLVLFVGDNGRPFPRAKRWLYDAGIHVPLIVRWPGVVPAAHTDTGLASLIDLTPSLLDAAGIAPAKPLDGRILFGPRTQPAPEFVFAARDRMDEVEDRSRAVRSDRFKYILNERPEVPYAAPSAYADASASLQILRSLHASAKLSSPATDFFAPRKPAEELYDLRTDPHEIHNLADDPAHAATLERLREALAQWRAGGDLGLTPEQDLLQSGHLLPFNP